jgi:hypothetical protein
MNHSIYSADRTTHLKVVVIVALIAGILVDGFGISMRNSSCRERRRLPYAGQCGSFLAYLTVGASELLAPCWCCWC